ncbi:Uncharacterized protein OS=Sorangium cellulosum (strain So ce56) GN=sce5710 PE=4 SV=1 [Gemmataceae bacterium]|nr:Uncharacterized protein OS=Sorangium cellulosum (strain So ce56) GN=sce5710 PE=4 SV=1 [Gemmataceae bacterium]VTT98985.1 Uncharacterized protein OS=Sorangium cellulosum (strain So ce56) GN=sce5710 PE=4 SV=1 [Gemmataceae bacterium]
MDESGWCQAELPYYLLRKYGKGVSGRKLRLFAAACCRRLWGHLPDDRRRAVELVEGYADGEVTARQWRDGRRTLRPADEVIVNGEDDDPTAIVAWYLLSSRPLEAAMYTPQNAVSLTHFPPPNPAPGDRTRPWTERQRRVERAAQVALLCGIAGGPTGPPALDPVWCTPAVVALAAHIYAERAFERLPELADALADAGCADAAVLGHCRRPGPRARGCWVVDRVLGRD